MEVLLTRHFFIFFFIIILLKARSTQNSKIDANEKHDP